MRPKVFLIGAGLGNPATMTQEAKAVAQGCDLLIGAPRLLEPWAATHRCASHIPAAEIAACIAGHDGGAVGVLLSGDVGFYSGAKALYPLLEGYEVETLPGLSSLTYFCAKLRTPWQDAVLVSAHGRSHNGLGEIQRNEKTFLLTGGQTRAQDICRALTERGLGHVRISVGEQLSYPEERIVTGTAEALAGQEFSDLAVVLAENPAPVRRCYAAPGIPDGDFLRGEAPMTKEEVRTLAVSKLRLTPESVVWDVGAGTGSVSVECALAASAGRVYAIEQKDAPLALLEENKRRFGVANLTIVPGSAPEALRDLPAPDRVFLGGTSGNLEEILGVILDKNATARIVCAAVTLETLAEAARCFGALDHVDMVQLSATRTRQAGRYHLMDAQNPVWLICGEGRA